MRCIGRRGVLHENDKTFNNEDVYRSDRYQMRVRLAGLACLTALRDKERRATLLHHCVRKVSLFKETFVGEKFLYLKKLSGAKSFFI